MTTPSHPAATTRTQSPAQTCTDSVDLLGSDGPLRQPRPLGDARYLGPPSPEATCQTPLRRQSPFPYPSPIVPIDQPNALHERMLSPIVPPNALHERMLLQFSLQRRRKRAVLFILCPIIFFRPPPGGLFFHRHHRICFWDHMSIVVAHQECGCEVRR